MKIQIEFQSCKSATFLQWLHQWILTQYKDVLRNRGWVGDTTRIVVITVSFEVKEWKSLRRDSNPRPCAPSFWPRLICGCTCRAAPQTRVLPAPGLASPWYSGWLVGSPWGGLHSFMARVWIPASQGYFHPNSSVARLRLQHVASVPAPSSCFYVNGFMK